MTPKTYRTLYWVFTILLSLLLLMDASRVFVGDGIFLVIFPLIMLAFMFVPNWLWKKIRPSL